jgi:exodeoxyribonuclease VII small subunit
MAKSANKPVEQLSYEDAYAELDGIVDALESGDQPLEAALSLFERGQMLSKHCTELLAKAELKVEELSGGTLQPFQESE